MRGFGDVGMWGCGDVGMWGFGDVGMWGCGDAGIWEKSLMDIADICTQQFSAIMEQHPPNNELPQGLTPEQNKHFDALRQALAESEQRSKSFEEGWSNLFDQNKSLREENHQLQQDYQTLRIQKGGFGIKMLMFSGMGGFFTALLLCFVYLKIKPKDPHTTALHHFRRTHLFEYELALSKKQFDEVKISLKKELHNPDYQPIQTHLEIIRDLLESAEKGCEQ